MSVLVITLPAAGGDGETEARWALVGEEGGLIAQGFIAPGARPDLPDGVKPSHGVALMPAEDLQVRYLAVPGRNEREAAKAAPFLIEEELAAPLDTQHVAIGARGEDGRCWLFAASKTIQARWRSYLAGLGVTPVYGVPDAMMLDGHGGDLTLITRDGVILYQTRAGDLVRQGGRPGEALPAGRNDPVCGGIDAVFADHVLPAIGRQVGPKRLIVSPDIDPGLVAPDETPIAVKRGPPPDFSLQAGRAPQSAFAALPAFFGEALVSGIDWPGLIRPWRRAAVLAGLAALGAAALLAGEGMYYAQRADAFYAASRDLYRAEFDERAADPAAQLRARLIALGGGPGAAGFLTLAAALAEVAAETEAVRIDSVRYSAERGGLSVSAAYRDFADFERFRAVAEARGLVIEEGGARQGEDAITGEFLVRLP